jgi:hypothetical protein
MNRTLYVICPRKSERQEAAKVIMHERPAKRRCEIGRYLGRMLANHIERLPPAGYF